LERLRKNKMTFDDVLQALTALHEDNAVPRNVKLKVDEIIAALKQNDESSIKVHKALHLLEEISDDINVQSYTRTQIWDIVSKLENR